MQEKRLIQMKKMVTGIYRRITILAVLFVFNIGGAMSQVWLEYVEARFKVKDTAKASLIRFVSQDIVAVCFNDSNTGSPVFAYFNAMNFGTNPPYYFVELDTSMFRNVKINDMQVLDKRLYFCGTNGSYGFIGWFDVFELSSGPSTHIHGYYVEDQSKITQYNKLAVYKQGYDVKIAAIGNADTRLNRRSDRLVEYDVPDGIVFPTCRIWYPPIVSGNKDYFDDIVCTDNYVVVIGATGPFSNNRYRMVAHKYRKGNFVSSDLDDLFLYSNVAEPTFRLDAERMVGDKFALVVPERISLYFPETHFYLIDAATMNVTTSQYIVKDAKADVLDMTYIPSTKSLAIALDYFNPHNHPYSGDVVIIDPFAAAPYNALCLYGRLQKKVNSLTVVNDLMLMGIEGDSCFRKDPSINPATLNNISCYDYYENNVDVISNPTMIHSVFPTTIEELSLGGYLTVYHQQGEKPVCVTCINPIIYSK